LAIELHDGASIGQQALIGAHPALRRVLVEDVRQKDKINVR
jgi:hypothetical protein